MKDKNEYRALLAEAEKLMSESTHEAIRDRIALRDAVCDYLEAERAKGVVLETILESVEEILKRAESRVAGSVDGHVELARQLIDWCIELDRSGKLRIVQ